MTDSEAGGVANRDIPQAADTNAQPPSSGAPVAKPAHRVLVPVLLVLATIVGAVATFAVWVNRQALNTSNWTSTSSQILENKQVQTTLSAYLVHELFSKVDVSADLQKLLPTQLQPLAGPAAAGLQQLAGAAAPKVLASPQAQAAWVQANTAAHKELLNVLNGGGPVASTTSGVVTLNLHALVSQLAASMGLSSQVASAQSELQGASGASAKASAQKKLGITLPATSGQLVILRSNQLKTAQDIANGVENLAIVLPALSILLFALAVYLARARRRRALRMTGWCFVLIGVALLLIRRFGGNAVVNGLVKVPSNKPAVHEVWSIGTSLLYNIAVAMIVFGLVIVAAAWLAGPTRPATALRRAMAPSLRDHPAVAYSVVGAVLLLLVLWGPTPAFRNVWWILVFAVLLALGVTMLRRETAAEFPGIEQGQALTGLAAPSPPPAAGTTVGGSGGSDIAPDPSLGRVETLERLAALRGSGAITNDEYQAEKAHVMSHGA